MISNLEFGQFRWFGKVGQDGRIEPDCSTGSVVFVESIILQYIHTNIVEDTWKDVHLLGSHLLGSDGELLTLCLLCTIPPQPEVILIHTAWIVDS